ncbi:hypothetical protein [Streptomyces griseoloalbus]|uniref:Uncharacterized protein n=1 Tax=Streptomyces griseoloalbus TaxID=67303 RepID=A0A7W8BY33_9ACTN|nr:hypothetical protein [Streptomyces albaduncus]MBB5129794.1 hypothetical protein [Streptomyces albaduncus]GGW81083.1 hypothetical protein GCM10010340_69080 [Streptomyces albaduncus]
MAKIKFTAFSTNSGTRAQGSGEAILPDHVQPERYEQTIAQRLADQGHKDATVTVTSVED